MANKFTAGLICGWIMFVSQEIVTEWVHPGLPTLGTALARMLH